MMETVVVDEKDPLGKGQVHGPPHITVTTDPDTKATRIARRFPAVRGVSGLVARISADRKRVERLFHVGDEPVPAADLWLPAEEIHAELDYGYCHGAPTVEIHADKVVIRHPAELVVRMTALRDPRWAGAAAEPGVTAIDCHCTFRHLGKQEVPFSARPDDPEPHGRDLYARLIAGEFGPIAPFVST